MRRTKPVPVSITEPGAFVIGCNYWASHAGTHMWSDWRPDVVAADLEQLAKEGMQVLRGFPLWPDFQPLTHLRTGQGTPLELRHGEAPLPPTAAGQAGLSEEMLQRFQAFADLAERHGLKLVVGLITGWMSGRFFAPPALEMRNVLTDPVAIQWQVRFVRCFVRRFRTHPAVAAWDLGNECNCMAAVPSSEAAWLWTAAITGAIRLEDPTRPVVSGMHGMGPDRDSRWRIQDQAELTDLLTTHPYPIFTPHCDQDPVNTLRPSLHATAESRYYADIAGKPCLAEEVGTLGPMVCSEAVAADYIRTALFSLWAHDCHGLLWWCAYDQLHVDQAPYDWHSCERELGLLRGNREVKPVTRTLARFRAWLEGLPIRRLPPRQTEAVCVLSAGQDQWGTAFSAFVLAKQAGFDLEYQFADQPLKAAPLYLVPAVSGAASFSRRFWLELLERVKRGATLYLSHHTCLLAPFTEEFGIEVATRERRTGPAEIRLTGESVPLTVRAPFRLALNPLRAEVLGREPDGNPVFTSAAYGKGRIFFLGVPIELELSNVPAAFHGPTAQPFWTVYRRLSQGLLEDRVVGKDLPQVGVTEHRLAARSRVVVLINYSPAPVAGCLTLRSGWSVGKTWYGKAPVAGAGGCRYAIGANDGLVTAVTGRR